MAIAVSSPISALILKVDRASTAKPAVRIKVVVMIAGPTMRKA